MSLSFEDKLSSKMFSAMIECRIQHSRVEQEKWRTTVRNITIDMVLASIPALDVEHIINFEGRILGFDPLMWCLRGTIGQFVTLLSRLKDHRLVYKVVSHDRAVKFDTVIL